MPTSPLGRLSDSQAAAILGITPNAATKRRQRAGIPARGVVGRQWTKAELRLLGTMPDAALAERLGVTRKHVLEVRRRRGVQAFAAQCRPKWISECRS